jgi:hypothetical protein
VEIAECRHKG